MVKIIADSTCDLTPALIEKYDISILPLHILLGEQDYRDGLDITPRQLFAWADANKATPKTAAFSVAEACAVFRPFLDQGMDIICFSISSQMSASYQNMLLAAKELNAQNRIRVIDSQNLSTGIGHLVIEAAILAKQGASLGEIAAQAEALRPRVRASFVVDTLTYLHRGGRCSGLAAMAGGVLHLHPKIVVSSGTMSPDKKYRGNIAHVTMKYAKEMERELLSAKPERVFITHSCAEPAVVDTVREYLASLNRFTEILETHAGGVISSHCGPGTLGVLYIAGEE